MKKTINLKKDLNIFFKNKQPLIIEGEAGIGKTSIVEEFAIEKNITIHKVLASSMDETDIAGIVVYDKETGFAKTISPLLAKYCQEPCIVFFDELNTARKEVQDTLLTLIQSRTFPNGDKINKEVWFVGAQNPSISYNNYEMSPAMKNRFAWLHFEANEQTFAEYLKTKRKTSLISIIIEGLENEKIKFSKFNEDDNVFTSPRSLSNMIDSCETLSVAIEYAGAFVSSDAHLYLKTLYLKDKKSIENEIFDKSFNGFKLKNKPYIIK